MDRSTLQSIGKARRLLRDARRLFVLTGAGVSSESGVPTFRGAGGLWRTYRPEQLATPEAFARDPRLVWEWYAYRRGVVAGCRPNAAHTALAALGSRPGLTVTIATQNVDRLHRVAAELQSPVSAPGLIELHGDLFTDRCTTCDWRLAGPFAPLDLARLPRCDSCGELARPGVVWFGESLDPDQLGRAAERAAEADLCLVVGTSAVVHPAAGLAATALRAGARLVEVNPDVTPLSPAALRCPGPAARVIPELVRDDSSQRP